MVLHGAQSTVNCWESAPSYRRRGTGPAGRRAAVMLNPCSDDAFPSGGSEGVSLRQRNKELRNIRPRYRDELETHRRNSETPERTLVDDVWGSWWTGELPPEHWRTTSGKGNPLRIVRGHQRPDS